MENREVSGVRQLSPQARWRAIRDEDTRQEPDLLGLLRSLKLADMMAKIYPSLESDSEFAAWRLSLDEKIETHPQLLASIERVRQRLELDPVIQEWLAKGGRK